MHAAMRPHVSNSACAPSQLQTGSKILNARATTTVVSRQLDKASWNAGLSVAFSAVHGRIYRDQWFVASKSKERRGLLLASVAVCKSSECNG